MRIDEEALGKVSQGQQQLKQSIAESARLIEQAQHRVETSRVLTGGVAISGAGGDQGAAQRPDSA